MVAVLAMKLEEILRVVNFLATEAKETASNPMTHELLKKIHL